MDRTQIKSFAARERRIYELISRSEGLKAREIARRLGLTREEVNQELYQSPLMRELCYQDAEYAWHAVIRPGYPHEGLYEFSGYYGFVREFLSLSEKQWMDCMIDGCRRIGRNLNDTRGLMHSFRDCRQTMIQLFQDLEELRLPGFQDWEICFEFRLNRGRFIRIYADVLLITPERVFSLEFKMKNQIDPEEVLQAAKYTPYLEVVFSEKMEVLPALVLTGANDFFDFAPIGDTGAILPVCSGDMLFNVLNEYMNFLRA